MNRVTLDNSSNRVHQNVLGELVSVVCHRGNVNRGNFVSYHQVQGQWFFNDDSNAVTAAQDPLRHLQPDETVEILFFKNI